MMKKLRICILRSNPVRPDSRVEKEASALSNAGHQVEVVAWDRDSDHKLQRDTLKEGSDIDIVRIGYKSTFGEGVKNLRPYLKFQIKMMIYLLKNRKNYDVIHACDFDTAFFSSLIARIIKKRFVFDIFDFLYGEPQGFLQKRVRKAQIWLINFADATIICSDDRRKQIADARPRKLYVIHNSPPSIPFERVAKKSQDRIEITYVGILQDSRLLLEMAEVFKENPEILLNIAGFGIYEDIFKELDEKYENIRFWGRVPYDETMKLEQRADIMIAIYDPALENHRFAAPNKFYEGLMLGKPLIMVKGTGMSFEIEKNDIGVLIEYTKESFTRGLFSLIERRNNWEDMGFRMRKLYEEKYSWREMEKRLIALYSSIDR